MLVWKCTKGAILWTLAGLAASPVIWFALRAILLILGAIYFAVTEGSWQPVKDLGLDSEFFFNSVVVMSTLLGLTFGIGNPIRIHNKNEREQKELEKRLRREEAERERREKREKEEAHRKEQEQLFEELQQLGSESLALFDQLPKCLSSAENYLDQATIDFEEKAYSPFWSRIEQAAYNLGHFDECVLKIASNAEKFGDRAQSYSGKSPQFPIVSESVIGMSAANLTSSRMEKIVRAAHRDPHYSMIFEQRRTNTILIAGFSNLAMALDGLGQKIESSIFLLGERIVKSIHTLGDQISLSLEDGLENLNSNLDSTLTSLHESSLEANGQISTSIGGLSKTVEKISTNWVKGNAETLKMLDNIQRRRRPLPSGFRDGEY